MSKSRGSAENAAARIVRLAPRRRLLQSLAGLAAILTLPALAAFVTRPPGVVQAQRIELVDANGQVHAALRADTSGVVLTVIDRKGREAAFLYLNDDPRLTLRDAANREVAGLGAPRVQHLAK
jgi:hypothetical protein